MKGDFSRVTFDHFKHYSQVLTQQGRVQLDADENERQAIFLHQVRTLTRDLIGHHAGPSAACGFAITADGTSLANFKIGPGRYYVDGFLCENDKESGYTAQPDWLPAQPDWWPNDDEQLSRLFDNTSTDILLVYLDVWEHFVNAVQDETIVEKALNGPDTAARAKTVWQVKVLAKQTDGNDLPSGLTCVGAGPIFDAWIAQQSMDRRGKLRVKVQKAAAVTDPCITPPDAGYRGAENQLYRVEIHTGGKAGQATYKWSRENGSVVARWLDTDGNNLILDSTRGFAEGQWVELLDDTKELRGEPGTLVKLAKVEGGAITIDPPTASGSINRADFPRHPRVRRWDQHGTERTRLAADKAIPLTEGKDANTWVELEDGIVLQFQENASNPYVYRTGDYWLIPARVATGKVDWCQDAKTNEPMALPPHGIEHHYAPLAILAVVANDGTNRLNPTSCRNQIKSDVFIESV